MMAKRRLYGWIAFFGAAGALAALPELLPPDAATVEPAVAPVAQRAPRAAERAETQAAATPVVGADAIQTADDQSAAPSADLFAAKSWAPAPPPAPPAPPPPPPPPPAAPTAPPLPFKFIGKFDDATTLKAFLQRDAKAYAVAVGDVIDGSYRVASISAVQMTLIYLPLNIPQTLALGSPL